MTCLALTVTVGAEAQCAGCCRHDSVGQERAQYSPRTLIIWYDASAKGNKKRLMKAVRRYKATVLYDYKSFNGIAIRIPDDATIGAAMEHFKKVKGVLSVNRDAVMYLDSEGGTMQLQ